MTMFGFMMLRPLDEEGRAELARLVHTFGIELPEVASLPLPGLVPEPAMPAGLAGVVRRGDVDLTWQDGVPVYAASVSNPNRVAVVPQEFWNALRQNAPQSLWEAFTYLAFLESDYIANAKNPSPLEESWGVLQVNRNAWPQYSVEELTTYAGNIRAAVAIYNAQGFNAWFNSGRAVGLV